MISYYIIAFLIVILAVIILWEWRHQRRLSIRARLMREALRNRDFMFRLPTDGIMPGERDLQTMLNDMGGEINQLMARSEVESWQRLTRVLTHEIMNAVTPIQSITQAYMGSTMVKQTPLEEGIRAIYDTTRSLSAFVESYRKMTQLQTVTMEEIELERMVANLKSLYPKLSWHIDLGAIRTLRADASMMHQVLTNIVKNAVEAGAHDISLTVTADAGYTQLLISNNGSPIPAEVAREVFVPFFTTKRSGSGIGLSLARQMMMVQGGNLTLADTPQPGYHTTFVVMINSRRVDELTSRQVDEEICITCFLVNSSTCQLVYLSTRLLIYISSPRCHPAGARCSAPSAGSVFCCRSSHTQLPAFCRRLQQQNRCQERYAHRP